MEKYDELSEKLLDGWLSMSISIWNERLVSAMTYNESMVCNLLYKQYLEAGRRLTATDLCNKLHIRKSQMNVILNNLEKREIILRSRSGEDKRNVYIELTGEGRRVYREAHKDILNLPRELIERLGEEKARVFAATMKEAAVCFEEMMERR